MIDIHCHMLPGIDDGAHDMEDALHMARLAVEDGITDIIVTPHMQNGFYSTIAEKVLVETSKLQKMINLHNISLQVHPGAEVHIHPMLIENLHHHKIVTLCHANKYMLIELPALSIPHYSKVLMHDLILEQITPVIAHPERNLVIRKDWHIIVEWIEMGVMMQVNAGSLLGEMGIQTQKFAQNLLKNRMVHVLASDGHNTKTRRPMLSEAYRMVSKLVSNRDAELLKENAQDILKGNTCKAHAPLVRRKHFRFRWF